MGEVTDHQITSLYEFCEIIIVNHFKKLMKYVNVEFLQNNYVDIEYAYLCNFLERFNSNTPKFLNEYTISTVNLLREYIDVDINLYTPLFSSQYIVSCLEQSF